MKLSVIGMLAIGIILVAPEIKMPNFTPYIHGGGPIIPGTLFPYLFITIACGAISGFHALVSSGTTPKMIMKESHIKPIAVGSMLAEAMVSILALIAATSLFPLDYFQINVSPEKFTQILPQLQALGFHESNLTQLSAEVGEKNRRSSRWCSIPGSWHGPNFFRPARLERINVLLVPFCHHV